jgi:hypothetical protein
MRTEHLIDRVDRWPAPLAILVATCVIMTATALWA